MPKSKHRKNQKQKSAARSQRVKDQKNKAQKLQRDFIMNLIKQEQEKGMFNNNQTIQPVMPFIDGPLVDGPLVESPIGTTTPVIDGPVIEGPSI